MTEPQLTEIGLAALAYAERGIPVFPCIEKRPYPRNGFLDATTDPVQVRAWWLRWRYANIGVPTESLIVVDIDRGDDWPEDEGQRADLFGSAIAVARTPRGGYHIWFDQPAEGNWRNKVQCPARDVDIRADGGYVIVPPSEIGGARYTWVKSILDHTGEVVEPPDWILEAIRDSGNRHTDDAGEWAPDDAQAAQTERGVIQARDILPEGVRHDSLIRLAAAVRRIGFDGFEISQILHAANQRRCQPPLPAKEVDAIAEWAGRQDTDFQWESVLWMRWHVNKPLADLTSVATIEVPDREQPEPQPAEPTSIPAELLTVPGFIDEVMKLTLGTAPYPNRPLAFAGALALQAHLAARKVRDSGDARPNLYLLALADSGTGKEWPRKVNSAILASVGWEASLASTMVSTGGIEDALTVTPAMLYQTDEIDTLLNAINKDRDGRYIGLMGTLLTLYGGSSSLYVCRKRANTRDRPSINQPHVTIFGTAIPRNYYRNLSDEMGWNGFLSRTLIVEADARGRGRKAKAIVVPESVREVAEWWCQFRPGGGNLETWHPEPVEVPATPGAIERLTKIRELGDDEHPKAKARDDQAGMTLWSRLAEQASRLALVYACSANHKQPVIDDEAAEWACAFAEAVVRHMLGQIAHYGATSADEDEMARLMRYVRESGGLIEHSTLLRRMKMKARRVMELAETLIAREELEVVDVKTTRQKRRAYRIPEAGEVNVPESD